MAAAAASSGQQHQQLHLLRQLRLIPSGCQRWNRGIVATCKRYFAYCSTLAVYVHDLQTNKLVKLIAAHERTITSISWNPSNDTEFVTCGMDGFLRRWDVETEAQVSVAREAEAPRCVDWCPHDSDVVAVILQNGALRFWSLRSSSLRTIKRVPLGVTAVRWNYPGRGARLLACGLDDGSVLVLDHSTERVRHMKSPHKKDEHGPVEFIEWDPLSNIYFIVVFQSGHMSLFDVEGSVLRVDFERQDAPATMAAFAPHMPGEFFTINARVSVLTQWNVSNGSPKGRVRLGRKSKGLMTICRVPQSAQFVLAFMDGSVSLFDSTTNRVGFSTQPGHSETVFDCRLKPSSPDLLATASYDGTVKVWHTTRMQCVASLHGQDGVLYALSWAPDDEPQLCSSSSNGSVFIWDTQTGQVLHKLNHHTKASYRVAWNTKSVNYIASTSSDTTCVVFSPNGRVYRRYSHPQAVYGCDWNPFNRYLLCTGCQDGKVRIFDVRQEKPVPVVLEGHSKRVFNTVWSPLIPNVIASGSDDLTVRVWRISDDMKHFTSTVLEGHTANVRALVWSTEIPWLLLSGSWDGTIRLWDIRSGACIDTVRDHHADVYGLTSHPQRPFVFVSSSRDTSLRFWSCEAVAANVKLESVPKGVIPPTMLASVEEALEPNSPPRLCGARSAEMSQQQASLLQSYSTLFEFFSGTPGVGDFWDLCASIVEGVPTKPTNEILHVGDLAASATSEAKALQAAQGLGRVKHAENLLEAAQVYLRIGEVREYCEILVTLGHWEKAIASAPLVSHAYWVELSRRCGEDLVQCGSTDAVPHLLAAGETERLVDFLVDAGELKQGLAIAVASAKGRFSSSAAAGSPSSPSERATHEAHAERLEEQQEEEEFKKKELTLTPLVRETARRQAMSYFEGANPVLGACCMLSVNDAAGAVQMLRQGHEIELAVAATQVLGLQPCGDIWRMLSLKFETHDMWDEAVNALRAGGASPQDVLCLAARVPDALQTDFRARHGIPQPEVCERNVASILQLSQHTHEQMVEALALLVGAGKFGRAITEGIAMMKRLLVRPAWDLVRVQELLVPLLSADLETLPTPLRLQFLAYVNYVGALRATSKGYYVLLPFMFESVNDLSSQSQSEFPVSSRVRKLQLLHAMSVADPLRCRQHLRSLDTENDVEDGVAEAKRAFAHVAAARANNASADRQTGLQTLIIPNGSDLPSAQRNRQPRLSLITRRPIQGQVLMLEDRISATSHAEILMWAEVNPFSPLHSGVRLKVFV